ncbi:BACON domain-containing carbohydrate-binding protein [Prolixibacteraceae bacterium]|nr:BACON domain-containing carbohydrate-binding protein [Prolixibacteraceae bacterium]
MKQNRITQLFTIVLVLFLFTRCDKNIEGYTTEDVQYNTNYPDLRFSGIKKRYDYPAKDAIDDQIQVKSLYHQWEIKSTTGNTWCKVLPNTGKAGDLFDVKITPENNTGLDDRVDTLVVTSEGWDGAKFVVFQKGIAFLKTTSENPVLKETIGDIITVNIESNQNWKAKIKDGIDWMKIQSGETGSNNGEIKIASTKENSLLRKDANLYIFDRHDKLCDSISIFQNGLYLKITTTLDKFETTGGASVLSVSSNTAWTVEVPEEAKDWISIDKMSGDQDGTLNMTVSENKGGTRSTYIKVNSDPELTADSILVEQIGSLPFTQDYWNANEFVTFNANGSATLLADAKTGTRTLKSKLSNFSYGKYTIEFSDLQIPSSVSTMLMCITKADKVNGGISWGFFANPRYSDGWASEHWISDDFGSTKRQRVDNDILKTDIKKLIIDIKKSNKDGMVDIDFYINDQLIRSEHGVDGFANGDDYCISFWIYNMYSTESAIFEPKSLLYEPYN